MYVLQCQKKWDAFEFVAWVTGRGRGNAMAALVNLVLLKGPV